MKYIIKEFGLIYHEAVTREQTVCETVVTPAVTCNPSHGNNPAGTTINFPEGVITISENTCSGAYDQSGDFYPICTPCTPKPAISETTCNTYEVIITPAYYSLEPSNAWNAGADNQTSVIRDNGILSVVMKESVNGVVVGLNEPNSFVTYQDFNYAIYFTDGEYAYMKNGQLLTNKVAYVDDTVFEIKKERDRVVFFVNDVIDYIIRGTTPAFLYADSSLYSSGDTIYNALIYDGEDKGVTAVRAQALIEGFTTLEPLIDVSIYTGDRAGSRISAFTTLEPLNSNISQAYSTDLPLPNTYATIGGAQGVNADLPKLYVASYQGLLEPQVMGSNGYIVGITSTAETSWYRYIESAGTLPNIWGYSVPDGHYAMSADIPSPWSYNNVIPEGYWDNWALIQTPKFELNIEAKTSTGNVLGADILAPKMEVVASGGSDSAEITVPGFTLSATATINVYGSATVNVPSKSLTIDVELGSYATVDVNAPKFTVYGEDVARNSAYLIINDIFTVSASILVGQSLSVDINAPGFELEGTATRENYGTIDINVPDFISSWGLAEILVPVITLDAYTELTLGSVNQVIVMNINTNDITEYTDYDFDNIISNQGITYGVKSDGIYSLSGDLDIDQEIDAEFTFSNVDYESPKYKFKPYVYFGLRTGDDLTYQPIVDDVTKLEFPIGLARNGGHRVQIAKGIKGRFWGATLRNVAGSDFELQSIDENILESTRRV